MHNTVSSPANVTASIERQPACLLLRIAGDFRLWNHPEREEELLKLLPQDVEVPGGHIVLSLQGITHIDSRGIGALVRVPIACTKRNLRLSVVLPSGLPGIAVTRTRIFSLWPQFENEVAALASAS